MKIICSLMSCSEVLSDLKESFIGLFEKKTSVLNFLTFAVMTSSCQRYANKKIFFNIYIYPMAPK